MEKDEIYFKVGDLVREAREAARLTQAELGEHIGLTRASVTNIEKARQKVQLHTLYAIADALEISVHSLLPTTRPADAPRDVSPRLRGLIGARKLRPEDRQKMEDLIASALPSSAPTGPKPDAPKRSKKTST